MKFSKTLRSLIDEAQPDWRDQFLSYKDLKQQLNLIYPKDGEPRIKRLRRDAPEGGRDCVAVAEEVVGFVGLLDGEINKINGFFMDKEEEHIIRWAVH